MSSTGSSSDNAAPSSSNPTIYVLVPTRHHFGDLIIIDRRTVEGVTLKEGDRYIGRMHSEGFTTDDLLDARVDNEHYRQLYPPENNSYDTRFMHGKPEYSDLYKLLTKKELPGVDRPVTCSAHGGTSHGVQIASSPASRRAPALSDFSRDERGQSAHHSSRAECGVWHGLAEPPQSLRG